MLTHLLDDDPGKPGSDSVPDIALPPAPLTEVAQSFLSKQDATASDILNGQANTASWLKSLGVDDEVTLDPGLQKALAAEAFSAITGVVTKTPEETKERVLALRHPDAVQRVVGMLTAYDWAFVEKAKEIRGYIVTQLLEEAENAKNKTADKLKALKMLGDVTEIGLFTQRVEVTTKSMTDEQVETEIRRRLENITMNPDTPLVERVDTEVDDA